MKYLTKHEMWDQVYKSHDKFTELKFDWRHYYNYLIAKKIEGIGLDRKNVLEIGAGDSKWLPYFAKKYRKSQFAGLDYTKTGCEKLALRMIVTGGDASIDIYHQDMFVLESSIHGKFDTIFSFGVVEHFSDLSQALLAKQRYLKKDGLMFTLIPNMAGSIGWLTRLFNRNIYEMHNPHDLESFIEGHRKAGMIVLSGGYLGSTNYLVLSSCFNEKRSFLWYVYAFLVLLSMVVGYLESKFGDFPVSKTFSPYIYVISRKI